MSAFRKSNISSRLEKFSKAEPRLVAAMGKDAPPQPQIVRQFGNGYQRIRREETIRIWSAKDETLRKCVLVVIFSIVCLVITCIFYTVYISFSTFKDCERSHDVNRYLYKQTVMECFQSRIIERRNDIGRSLGTTFGH